MKPRFLVILALGLPIALGGCGKLVQSLPAHADPSGVAVAKAVPLAQLPRTVKPLHYRVALTVDPGKDRFTGHTEIDVEIHARQTSFFIHGLELHIARAEARTAAGRSISAQYKQVDDSGVATLKFAEPLPAGGATLVFDYDAPFNTSLAGIYRVDHQGESYAFTQFENTDARRAFPSFDEPGFKTPFDLTITAPSADTVVANTAEVSKTPAGGMTKWTFETTKPLPTYLVALAVGPLDVVDAGVVPPNRYRSYPLPLRGIAAKGMGPKLHYALSLTPAIVTALEEYYGIGFPFQKLDTLAVPDFAAGAMENSGAITYREQLLLMNDDAPLDQKRSSLTVQAHEIAHQWFGDLVTPRWWDDIWLNESFATWMEYKIAQKVRPDQEFQRSTLSNSLNVMRLDELPSARQIHNPVNNPDDIDNAFDDITYSKGGAVLSMFESYVGEEAFRQGIHAYLTKFSYRNASAQDFIGAIAQTAGRPEIIQSFREFIDQPHVPSMGTSLACSAGKGSARVTETMYRPIGIEMQERRWHVPMCLAAEKQHRVCQLVPPSGADVPLGGMCPKTVFPNVEGAGYYRFSMDEDHWRALVATASSLSAAEQFTLFHNLTAALRAGHATANDFLALIRALAPSATWDTVDAIRDVAHETRVTGAIAPHDLTIWRAHLIREFGPRLQSVGLAARAGERPADAMLRQSLVELLVEEARDQSLIARLAKASEVYLASNRIDRDGLPAELMREALRAGVMSSGARFSDRLVEAVKHSDDAYFTQSAIYAIAGSEDETNLNKLLALALTPTIRTGDLRYVRDYFSEEMPARSVLWTWFKGNFAAIENRLSRYGMGGMPEIQAYACDAADKTDLQTFLGPKASELVGMPRTLRQVREKIERCIAFKTAKGAEISAAFGAR
ncbi:MAG: M1 family metallopeptidase [Alphaproteobacteria bacterium]|nr:M1 family metallopeptidase [Alphaproteobacteria bacterium]